MATATDLKEDFERCNELKQWFLNHFVEHPPCHRRDWLLPEDGSLAKNRLVAAWLKDDDRFVAEWQTMSLPDWLQMARQSRRSDSWCAPSGSWLDDAEKVRHLMYVPTVRSPQ